MKTKLNCWEYMQCGRQPGGIKAKGFGVCLSSTKTAYDGFNSGQNAGRACWLVAGSFANSRDKNTCAAERKSCVSCDFFLKVRQEEGNYFKWRKY